MRCAVFAITILVVAAFLNIDVQARQGPAEGPVAGSAYVDVTVVDGLGAPLEGVIVTLTGMVNREAVSDGAGLVSFNALPAGRYDVVARMATFAPSLPRVFDLPPFGGTSLPITLKPHGPAMGHTLACGGFDPSSIRSLASGAELVVHVVVTNQEMVEGPSREEGVSGQITTINRVEVVESFQSRGPDSISGSTITVRQGGGRIDRGEFVYLQGFNRLDPLNVGDEYVLFLVTDHEGAYWIHGSEEGAFRIRNGVVEPLGAGGAATTWKRRASEKFFEALRTLDRR